MNIWKFSGESKSGAEKKSVSDIQLRSKTGVTLLAMKRGPDIIEHPTPEILFQSDDIVYVLGNPEQVNLAFEIFSGEE